MRGGRGIFAGAKTGYVVLRIEPSPALPASLSPLRCAPGLPAPFHAQQGAALRAPPLPLGLSPSWHGAHAMPSPAWSAGGNRCGSGIVRTGDAGHVIEYRHKWR